MMLRNRILSTALSLCLLAGAALPAYAEEAVPAPFPTADEHVSEDLPEAPAETETPAPETDTDTPYTLDTPQLGKLDGPLTQAEIVKSGTCGINGGNLTWTYDNEALTISGTGEMVDYTYTGGPWHNFFIRRLIIENGATSIGDYAFSDCTNLTSVTIPDSVASIGDYAFCRCTSLTSVTVPNSVTTIGESAFYNCTGLTSVSIPSGVTTIESSVFSDCSNLASISLPNSVTDIKGYAFSGCSSLTGNLILPSEIARIYPYAFAGTGITRVDIPENITLGFKSFNNCSNLTKVTIPSSITLYNGEGTKEGSEGFFSNCKKLTSAGPLGSGCNIEFGWTNTIPECAFMGCNGLSNIILPNSITSIGNLAFNSCSNLSNIAIPDGVTSIGKYAFAGCSGLSNITIPDSITSIGIYAFSDCSSLAGITIPDSITSIEIDTFHGCSSLTSISIPQSVTDIKNRAFYNCSSLSSITIPNSVTSIGSGAFYGCSKLTNVSIPTSVTSIGFRAFWGCTSLSSIEVDSANQTYISQNGVVYIRDMENKEHVFLYPEGKAGVYTIPNGVISIGDEAFRHCSRLASITIPNSVISIGEDAFSGCSGLTSIFIPNSLTSIEKSAFSRCSALKTVLYEGSEAEWQQIEISDYNDTLLNVQIYYNSERPPLYSLTVTGSRAPSSGAGEYEEGTSVTLRAGAWENRTFTGWTVSGVTLTPEQLSLPNLTFTMPANHVTATARWVGADIVNSGTCGRYGDNLTWTLDNEGTLTISGTGEMLHFFNTSPPWGTSCVRLVIEDGVTSIGDYAFCDCSGLTGPLSIPSSVTSIGDYAFNDCSKLTGSLSIPDRVTYIGNYAFYNCSELTGPLSIPSGVTFIGSAAFYHCSGITGPLVIPNGVTSIGHSTFSGCSGLTGPLVIPNNITSIGGDAFAHCSGLTSVTISNSITSIENGTFSDCSGFTGTLSIPDSVDYIGDAAFYNCSGLTGTLSIPNSVTYIGEFAFSSCSGFTGATISSGVTSIPYEMFYDCSGLTHVTIPSSITYIEGRAFYNCSSLQTVFYAGGPKDWQWIELNPANDPLLDATFYYHGEQPISYSLTITQNNAPSTGTGNYLAGTLVSLHAGTWKGHIFTGWTITGVTLTPEQLRHPNLSFTMPANNVTATASWKEYTLLSVPITSFTPTGKATTVHSTPEALAALAAFSGAPPKIFSLHLSGSRQTVAAQGTPNTATGEITFPSALSSRDKLFFLDPDTLIPLAEPAPLP